MNLYEILYIVFPDLEANLSKITTVINEEIKKSGGEIVKEEIWGQQKLAYHIKNNDTGIYVLLYIKSDPENINKIGKFFHLNHEIMRYIILAAEESALLQKPEIIEGVLEEVEAPKKVKKEIEVEKKKEEIKEKPKKKIIKKEKPQKPEKEEIIEEKEREKKVEEKLKEILEK